MPALQPTVHRDGSWGTAWVQSVSSSRGEGAAGHRAAEAISYGEVASEEQSKQGSLVEKERDPTEVWFWLSARPCTAFGSVGVAVVGFCFSSLKSF